MELKFELPEGHLYLSISKLLDLEKSTGFLKEPSSNLYELAKDGKCIFVTDDGEIHPKTEDIKQCIIVSYESRILREGLILELKNI